jgi:shingomyelin synthase
LKKLALLNALLGSFFLLLSHSHYTVDVIIAYYITTRLFWSYHGFLANYNQTSPEWWHAIFKYFEKNSARNFPNEFEVPWTNLKKRHSEESQI